MTIDASAQFLQETVESALSSARETTSRIHSGTVITRRDPTFNYTVSDPALQPPPQLSDLFPGVDNTDAEIARLNQLTNEWLDDYFPAISNCLRTIPEDWLCGVISGTKPYGLDATVLEVVWQRARSRAQRTAESELAQVRMELSARGFGLPTGVLVRAVTSAEQRVSDAVAEINVEQAIKDADIKVDLLKFAVGQANDLKLGVFGVLATFMRQWADVPNQDIQRAAIRAQAMSSLYNALGTYYNVEVAFEEMRLKAIEMKAQTDLSVDRNRIATAGTNNAAGALGQAVQGFANVAGSAAGAQSALFANITSAQ